MEKILLKDIVIPAGTIFTDAPTKTERYGGHLEGFVGLTKDTCGSFVYPFDDDKELLSEYFADVK